jgi:hypothetical protein
MIEEKPYVCHRTHPTGSTVSNVFSIPKAEGAGVLPAKVFPLLDQQSEI